MPDIKVYLTEEEYTVVKDKPKGWVHTVVSDALRGNIIPEPEKVSMVTPKIIKKGDGLNTCKSCGYLLPYFKGRCKNGCK